MSPIANYDQRDIQDYRFGQLSSGITALDTTLASTAFAPLPATPTTTRYIPVTIADDSLGLYETVWITAHTAASQSVTVVRGREGSSARAWAAGSTWRIAPTIRDVVSWVATRGALPTDAHLGMAVGIAAEGVVVEKTSAGWSNTGAVPFGHVGATAGFQNIGAATNGVYVQFAAAQELAGGMTFDNANDALVVPVAGLYLCSCHGYFTGASAYDCWSEITVNDAATPPGLPVFGARTSQYKQTVNDLVTTGVVTRRLVAGDKLRLWHASPQSTYGTTGYNGAWLEALYVGP